MTAMAINDLLGLANEEAERLGQGYVGPEHLLLALLRDDAGAAGRALAACGLRLDSARAAVGRLVARGLLPGSPADAELLASVGIDLAEVRQRADATFGADAVDEGLRRMSRRRGRRRIAMRNPLCGRPLLVKRALALAAQEAALDVDVSTGHVLLGLLADGQERFGSDLGRRGRAVERELGFSEVPPHPLRLLLDILTVSPVSLRQATLAALRREDV